SPVPVPTVTPGSVSPNTSSPGFRSIPSRNLRTSTDANNQPAYAGASAPGGNMTRFMPNTGGGSAPVPAPQRDGDAIQQMILLEAQRAVNPNLPPTPGFPPSLPGTP